MNDVEEKIARLVALGGADATPEEEARSASRQACKLIVEHKLTVREKEPWDDFGFTKEEIARAYHGGVSEASAAVETARIAIRDAHEDVLEVLNEEILDLVGMCIRWDSRTNDYAVEHLDAGVLGSRLSFVQAVRLAATEFAQDIVPFHHRSPRQTSRPSDFSPTDLDAIDAVTLPSSIPPTKTSRR